MDYPLIIGGVRKGTAKIFRDGLYTVLTAEAEAGETLTRLWLCGEDRSLYLGIMEERNGRQYFSRRFTRRETEGFPENIACVSDSGKMPEPPAEPDNTTVWHRTHDGCLTAREGEKCLIALPSNIGKPVHGADIRTIEGREYIIFRY